jgi:hypothetical protein
MEDLHAQPPFLGMDQSSGNDLPACVAQQVALSESTT